MLGLMKLAGLALLGFQALAVVAQDAESDPTPDEAVPEELRDLPEMQAKTIQVSAAGTIAHSAIFGVKLVNNRPTDVSVTFNNSEPDAVTLALVVGSLSRPATAAAAGGDGIVRNLTAKSYDVAVQPGAAATLTYTFAVEMHPQDLLLRLVGVVKDKDGAMYTVPVMEESVAVVEAPTSIFDPQIIFLYLVLGAAFSGTCYFIYTTWVTTLFPQQKRRGGGGAGKGKRAAAPSSSEKTDGAEAAATGSKPYDESWIPPQHLQRPEARRVRSGTPKTKARG